MIHTDCAEPCCWPEVLAAAGGPSPITVDGCLAAITQGTLRSNDCDGYEFVFDRLPYEGSKLNLEIAESFRLDWVRSPKFYRHVYKAKDPYVQSSPSLGLAIDAAIEMLGLYRPDQLARWLGLDVKVFNPDWARRRNVDLHLRMGMGNSEIRGKSTQWGLPVTSAYVAQRRHRMMSRQGDTYKTLAA